MADIDRITDDVTIFGKDGNNSVDPVLVDGIYRLPVEQVQKSGQFNNVLLSEELNIRNGKGFFITSGGILTLAANGTFVLHIKTPASGKIFLRDVSFNITRGANSGNISAQLFETPTLSNDGTASTIYNNNRQSATTPTFNAYTAPTISNNGTKLVEYLIHQDWETYIAPSYTSKWQLILKQNTSYLIKLLSAQNQATDFTFLTFLAEEA